MNWQSWQRAMALKATPPLQRDLEFCNRALQRMQRENLLEPTRSTARRQYRGPNVVYAAAGVIDSLKG